MRVVFDTNCVVSALLFAQGQLSWLRTHWRSDDVIALVSKDTVDELIAVLAYPKFQLKKEEIEALLAEYLPHTGPVAVSKRQEFPRCRDSSDQIFVDLALEGRADVLVTGDRALLEMDIGVAIESPADYKRRMGQ